MTRFETHQLLSRFAENVLKEELQHENKLLTYERKSVQNAGERYVYR